jgi:group I intron endonuclease
MIIRVLENNLNRCGIYKITNLQNHKCYIGQSVNIAERWRQHVKRGLGVETITNNKLYPALKQDGVENFSFELIQECPRSDLNKAEKYWIQYFDSYNCGYNSTTGNK